MYLGFEIQDEMIRALLLSRLLDEYKHMIMGLESSEIRITTDAVKVKLLQEIQSIDETDKRKEAAFYFKFKAAKKGNTLRYTENTKRIRHCFNCRKPGHLAARCRSNISKQVRSKTCSQEHSCPK